MTTVLAGSADVSYTTRLREGFYRLGQDYPGYDQVLNQALFALLTREHVLWFSKPGQAKSAVAAQVFGLFDTSSVLSLQLTKDTLPDAIFGNLIARELIEKGEELFNLKGGLADVEFAYLDEFFDASDFVLRAMLTVLNERMFRSKDQGSIKVPLHTVIATTNYVRRREATEAVLDRILCKSVIPMVVDLTDAMRAGKTYLGFPGKSCNMPLLSYEQLLLLAELVECPEDQGGIAISPGMRMLHVILVQEFQRRQLAAALEKWHNDPLNKDAVDDPSAAELGIAEVSTRTMVKLHDMSRAAAVLNDRSEVIKGDQRAVGYGLVVVGDTASDGERIWAELCDEFLTLSVKDLKALEALAELADQVGAIKAERSAVTAAQLNIGGKLVVATSSAVGEFMNHVTGASKSHVVQIAQKALNEEVGKLGAIPRQIVNLKGSW